MYNLKATIILGGIFLFTSSTLLSQNPSISFIKAKRFADSVYKRNELDNALAAYKYAQRLNQSDATVKGLIDQISAKINEAKGQKSQSLLLFKQAKAAIQDGKDGDALTLLSNAKKLDPENSEIADLYLNVDNRVNKNLKLKEEFDKLVSDSRNQLVNRYFVAASDNCNLALKIFPKEASATTLLKKILEDKETAMKAYSALLAQAESEYSKVNITQAIEKLKQAANLMPEEKFPASRIKELEAVLDYQNQLEQVYKKSISEADRALTSGNTTLAVKKYREAIDAKPDESYPKNKIREIESRQMADQQKKELYAQSMQKGIALYENNDFENARDNFSQAASLNPVALEPKSWLSKVDDKLKFEKKKRLDFEKEMNLAYDQLSKREWSKSRDAFQRAKTILPDAKEPIIGISKLDSLILINDKAFSTAINSAEEELKRQHYIESIALFKEALILKPDHKELNLRIAAIEAELKKSQNIIASYEKSMKEGNLLLSQNKLADARAKFAKALELIPNNELAISRINEIDQKLISIANENEKVLQILNNAEENFSKALYSEALALFNEALTIQPQNPAIKSRRDETEFQINKIQNISLSYSKAIEAANLAYSNNDLITAKAKYSEANKLKPQEPLPIQKISEIDQLLAKNKQIASAIDQLVSDAEKFVKSENYRDAIKLYDQAITLKPDQKSLLDRKNELNIIADQIDKNNTAYQSAIANGESQFKDNNLVLARASFAEASLIKPSEALPKQRISEIDKRISDQNQKEAQFSGYMKSLSDNLASKNYTSAIKFADLALAIKANHPEAVKLKAKADSLNKSDIALNIRYKELVDRANSAFSSKDLTGARASYVEASLLKPSEKMPVEKIAEIDRLLAAESEINQKYISALQSADEALKNLLYDNALLGYKTALAIKPTEAYPKDQITKVTQTLENIKKAESQYHMAIQNGDIAFKARTFKAAIEFYQSALQAKPDATYPNKMIAKIDSTEKAEIKIQAEYDEFIAKGNLDFQSQDLSAALENYNQALRRRPSEEYPKDQIRKINEVIKANQVKLEQEIASQFEIAQKAIEQKQWDLAIDAFNKILALKPDQSKAISGLNETKRMKQEEARTNQLYAQAINSGDSLLRNKEFELALVSFKNSVNLKPNEIYPKEKISEIEKQINDQKAKQMAYDAHLNQGMRFKVEGRLEESLKSYEAALAIKSDASIIKEISDLKTAIQLKENTIRSYRLACNEAFDKYKKNDLEAALEGYIAADQILTTDSLKSRINSIKQTIAKRVQQEKLYQKFIKSGDSLLSMTAPVEALRSFQNAENLKPGSEFVLSKIASAQKAIFDLNKEKERYNQIVRIADSLLNNKLHSDALSFYEQAQKSSFHDQYITNRVNEIKEYLNQPQFLRGLNYSTVIAQAQSSLASKEYAKAADAFLLAMQLKPDEKQPYDGLAQIVQTLKANKTISLLNSSVDIPQGKEGQFEIASDLYKKNSTQYIILTTNVPETSNVKLVINYGNKTGTNGGFVYRLPYRGNESIYIFKISDESGWKTSNDWMSFISENGDLLLKSLELTTIE